MQAIVGQPESPQDRWNMQMGGKVSDNRDRPSGAREHGRLPENIAARLRSNLNGRVIGIYHQPRTSDENGRGRFSAEAVFARSLKRGGAQGVGGSESSR